LASFFPIDDLPAPAMPINDIELLTSTFVFTCENFYKQDFSIIKGLSKFRTIHANPEKEEHKDYDLFEILDSGFRKKQGQSPIRPTSQIFVNPRNLIL